MAPSRRTVLSTAAAGLVTAAAAANAQTTGAGSPPQPMRPGQGRHRSRAAQHSDRAAEPRHLRAAADRPRHGGEPAVPVRRRRICGSSAAAGPARSLSASSASPRRSPASNMRLNAGGVRELHWHKAAEWAYMLYGTRPHHRRRRERPQLRRRRRRRRPLVLPSGHPALDPGARARRLRVPAGVRRRQLLRGQYLPAQRLVQARAAGGARPRISASRRRTSATRRIRASSTSSRCRCRGRLAADRIAGATAGAADVQPSPDGAGPDPRPGAATVRIVDSRTSRPPSTIAAALVEVDPGAMRELHWHPNTDEWQYYIEGKGAHGRVRVVRRRPHLRLPGRRRRLRAVRHGPLHREHRRHARCASSKCSRAATTPTSRSIAGWRSPARAGAGHAQARPERDERAAQGPAPVVPV